jgi:hypothetical protein
MDWAANGPLTHRFCFARLFADAVMEIRIKCGCGQSVRVNASAGGQSFRCPECGNPLIVPEIVESPIVPAVVSAQRQRRLLWGFLGLFIILCVAVVGLLIGFGFFASPGRTLTIDDWWQQRSQAVADEQERFEGAWNNQRSKELLQIFTGKDCSKLPYKEFMVLADKYLDNPVEKHPRTDIITDTYANYINWFAQRNDMTVESALRYDYILTSEGVNLMQYELMLFRVGLVRKKAVGVPLSAQFPKRNYATLPRMLRAGEPKPKQNPQLSEDEKGFADGCKKVVKEIWKE